MDKKFFRSLDKELGKYGIYLIRSKTHRIYRGEVNGKIITLGCSSSPRQKHFRNAIIRDVRKKLKDAGVKTPPDLRL